MLFQHIINFFISDLDVTLSCIDVSMFHILLDLHNVLSAVVEVGYLSCTEVMALDPHVVLLVEPLQLMDPVDCWIVTLRTFEHHLMIRSIEFSLVFDDCLVCLRTGSDVPFYSLLRHNVDLPAASLIRLNLSDVCEFEVNYILNPECAIIEKANKCMYLRRVFSS